MMTVTEIFYSLQGEGSLAGMPSVFVRLAGCPLRCRWCDTKYAWQPEVGRLYSTDDIVRKVIEFGTDTVVLTGGEPMTDAQGLPEHKLVELTERLKQSGMHITIETTGIRFVPALKCDLMSISPKLTNSAPNEMKPAALHNKNRLNITALAELTDTYNYQLKFVIDSPQDIEEVKKIIDRIGGIATDRVLLMPQAQTRDELLEKSPMVAELCKQTGFTFGQRLQVLLWNNRPRH